MTTRRIGWVVLGVIGCGRDPGVGRPPSVAIAAPVAAPVVVPVDAAPVVDAAAAPDPGASSPAAGPPIASWRAAPSPTAPSSPACVVAGDRFVQYADLDPHGDPRFCLWWHLGNAGFPDVGCWRVELAAGRYVAEGGVWFATPQPQRVGSGGPAWDNAGSWRAAWHDGVVAFCRGATCQRVAIAQAPDVFEDQIAIDDHARLAVVPRGGVAGASGPSKAHAFSTYDLATGREVASFTIPDRHAGATLGGFVGPSLFVTDCDDHGGRCAWRLHDPRGGRDLGAVGGDRPLGAGGTAVMIDATRFAAVAGDRLVVQDAATGQVTARRTLPRAAGLAADDVALGGAAGIVVIGPDGRVLLVDPTTAQVTRTIVPPRCRL
jgi:hypothetical protein